MGKAALLSIVAVSGALALWLALRPAPPETAATGDATPAAESAAPAAPAAGARAGRAAPPAPPRPFPEQKRFTEEVREFFDAAAELPEDERASRAAALSERIAEQERAGTLLPQEALMLRLALLRATIADPAVLDHEIRSVTESYHAARAARASAPPDPRFELYKRRESELVSEVLALERIPGGLTRDEYLRRRLQELRSEIYSGAGPEPAQP